MLSPLPKLARNAKVAVVGSGVSGLMFSYFLAKLRPDIQINLIESHDRTGGWIKSWHTNDQNNKPVMLEQGPRTLRGVSDGTVLIIDTLRDLDKASAVQCVRSDSEANKKFMLGIDDKLVKVPESLGSAFEFLLNPLSKGLVTGLLGEPFRKAPDHPGQDETVSSFLRRRFGNDYVGKNILSAMFHGIYGDDINHMSAKRTMRKLWDLEQEYGSIMRGFFQKKPGSDKKPTLSPLLSQYRQAFGKDETSLLNLSSSLRKYPMLGLKGGLETFPNAVRQSLNNSPNVNVLCGKQVSSIQRSASQEGFNLQLSCGETMTGLDHIRLTQTPARISTMLAADNQELAQNLARIKANDIILVNYYLPGQDVIAKRYRGFGYLCPQANRNPQNLLGVIFDSVIERSFEPVFTDTCATTRSQTAYTKLTAMLGGHYLYQNGEKNLPSSELTIRSVKDVLNSHLGISQEALDQGLWAVTVAKSCLPRFSVGYDDWQSSVEQELAKSYAGAISVGGMGFAKGPGVPDVIADGLEDAIKLA
ncbi:hypothetical protein HG536_0C04150 [Torulaspora globosa]|uniref:Protoporphyrinogen oxidase n=1 Tax=Torulaspora globosa TaxID=48254 RepID=A0A7G3ZFG0_9SACH|nr:uncharacterized protein HG536_0C04150 [Torulaspora globosa]QLL32246.1 hypothetical protein HG536_0C04150 [Torulaspora globosa]